MDEQDIPKIKGPCTPAPREMPLLLGSFQGFTLFSSVPLAADTEVSRLTALTGAYSPALSFSFFMFCGLQTFPGFIKVGICVSVLILLVQCRFLRGKVCRRISTLPFYTRSTTPSSRDTFLPCSCDSSVWGLLFPLPVPQHIWILESLRLRCVATSSSLYSSTHDALIHSCDVKYLLCPEDSPVFISIQDFPAKPWSCLFFKCITSLSCLKLDSWFSALKLFFCWAFISQWQWHHPPGYLHL